MHDQLKDLQDLDKWFTANAERKWVKVGTTGQSPDYFTLRTGLAVPKDLQLCVLNKCYKGWTTSPITIFVRNVFLFASPLLGSHVNLLLDLSRHVSRYG